MANAYNEKSVALCKASSSISTIIGGVSSFITNFYVSKFPKNFFKKVYISESLNSTNLRDKNKFPQQMKPYLAVQSQFELGNTAMDTLPFWHTANYYIIRSKMRNYRLIFEDIENGIRIFSIPNRIKVNFNTTIKLETEMKAYDVLSYLNQNFEQGGFNYINKVRLPAEVPKIFMVNISKFLNLDYNRENDREKLREYLLEHSLGSINEVISMSTGNPTFMYNYTTNLLVNYPDLASHEKSIKNLIVKETTVNFEIGCELWIPGSFILEIENRNDMIYEINEPSKSDNKFKFNLVFDVESIPEKIGNKQFITKRSFLTDINEEVDELDLTPILSEELITVIKTINKYHVDMSKYIQLNLYLNKERISENNYEVDWKKFILKTKQPESNRTYTVFIYGDLLILNKVSDLIQKDRTNEIGKLLLY